jgi:hypothetical protein
MVPVLIPARSVFEQRAGVSDLRAMLAPYPSDEMICWPVSPRVAM